MAEKNYGGESSREESSEIVEDSSDIADYRLPICDVQTQRRNFPGYTERLNGLPLWDSGGTTETDSKTAPKSGGYSRINS